MVDSDDVVTLEDDDESFVEGEDPWANFDPVAVTELEARYEQVLLITDHGERLVQAQALIAEMNA